MGHYYNKTRGPLALNLRKGTSIVVMPRTWVEISPKDESTAGVIRAVKKGQLHKRPVRPEPEPVPEAVPQAAPAPEPVPEAKTVVETPADEGEEATATPSPKPTTKKRTTKRAR